MSKFVVTEQEFLEWKESNVTKAFMKSLVNDRESLKEMLLSGTENDEDVRGRAHAITNIIRMDYSDMMSSLYQKEE